MLSALHAKLNSRAETEVNRPPAAWFLPQDSFLRMLALERKRTERSQRRFVLMLLEADKLLKSGNHKKVFDSVIDALFRSSRETDVKGWYETGSVIGVIFTELGAAEGNSVANALFTKILNALGRTLSIEQVNELRISFHVYPEASDNGDRGGSDSALYPDLRADGQSSGGARLMKRSMDIAGSLCALILLSPLFAVIAALIKLTSRGPILFRQERIGHYGRRFTFLKFRSMYVDNNQTIHEEFMKLLIEGSNGAERKDGPRDPVYKLTDDKRITPLGRFLRRTSLDELPQFVNVLRGEMSLVGPRPPIPYEFQKYDLWHRRRVLVVKPGITGLWQVEGRSRVTFNEMVRMDLEYASTWSPWMDLKILLRTPAAVVSGSGAY
jgi:lipopolysaccharide/colanic/teichoic acid biosynthesis glycosyltransferase